jgi:hypothetical protein
VGLEPATGAAVTAVAGVVEAVPASMAFVLGAVLASTDPVTVSALGAAAVPATPAPGGEHNLDLEATRLSDDHR